MRIIFFLCAVLVYVPAYADGFLYNDKGKRDPLTPLVTKDGRILPGARAVTETGDIELEGVIWDPQGNSVAIINGKLVRERERILNMQVLKIRKASVILQREGKVLVIKLKKGGGEGK